MPSSLESLAAELQGSLQELRDTCAAHRMELEKLRLEEQRNTSYIQTQVRRSPSHYVRSVVGGVLVV